ncbi:MAG: CAP domain-containing protein, partial [Desulfocucumaceae bacterium]
CRSRLRKVLLAVLTLFLVSVLFTVGTAAPAAASVPGLSPSLDNQLIVDLVNRALAKAGLPNLNSGKIVVYLYNGSQKIKIPVLKPQPAPQAALQPVTQPQPKPVPQPQTSPGSQSAPVQGLNADEQRMLDLVNTARTNAGLKPLQADMALVRLARLKAQDMIANNYFSHTSPTYGSPFDMMKAAGVTYRYAGENLAGAPAVDVAHTNLMNSPGHRANILNVNFTKVGIGVV